MQTPITSGSSKIKEYFASWYGERFRGRKTSSGEVFNPSALTAASKTFAIGTLLKLTNRTAGTSIIVRINDYGPSRKGIDLDISEAAATHLCMKKVGIAVLEVEVIK